MLWQLLVFLTTDWSEQCCACIIPEEGVEITLDNICDELRSRGVSAYKLPERLEIFEEFPMTASGKVQRRNLAQNS